LETKTNDKQRRIVVYSANNVLCIKIYLCFAFL
jgi:hypothetical protein